MIKQTNLFRVILSLAMVFISDGAFAQTVTVVKSTAGGNLDNSFSPPLIETGLAFDYVIQYECQGALGQTCDDLQIVDVLPAGLVFQQVLTNPAHVTASNFDAPSNTVTVDFSPLSAGVSATFQITVLVPNGITTDGTTFDNSVDHTSSNAGSGTSGTVTVEANAQPRATIFKIAPLFEDPYQVAEGGAVPIRFRAGVPNITATLSGNTYNDCGTLNLENPFVSDIVPVGMEPVGPFPIVTGQYTATYDIVTRELRFDLADTVLPTVCGDHLPITILDTTLNFDITATAPDLLNNTACVSGDPIGQPTVLDIACDSQSFNVVPLGIQGDFNKIAVPDEVAADVSPNFELRYRLIPSNASSTAGVDDFYMIDVIPTNHINVVKLSPGNMDTNCADVEKLEVYYQTNLLGGDPPADATKTSPDWQLLFSETAAAGDDCSFNGQLSVPLSAGEYVTAVKWEFGAVTSSFNVSSGGSLDPEIIYTLVNPGRDSTVLSNGDSFTNCATLFFDYDPDPALSGSVTDCDDVDITEPYIVVNAEKSIINSDPQPYTVGDTFTYRLRVRDVAGNTSLEELVVVDLLPLGIDVVGVSGCSYNAGLPDSVYEQISNYNGTGRTLIRLTRFANPAGAFFSNFFCTLDVDVVVTNSVIGGTDALVNTLNLTTNQASIGGPVETRCLASTVGTDVDDLDGDGDTTDVLCQSTVSADVVTLPSLDAQKLVQGDQLAGFSGSGLSVAGGTATYRINLVNDGNSVLRDIVIVDTLPRIGDTRELNDTVPRNTQFPVTLTGAVDESGLPTGSRVEYSVDLNPCITELQPLDVPPACVDDWVLAGAIADFSLVTAIKIVLYDSALTTDTFAPGASLNIDFDVNVSLSALNSEAAVNSFAVIANDLVVGNLLVTEVDNVILLVGELDFGDAPAPYKTTQATGGAVHVLSTDLFLGSLVDAEVDGLPDPLAAGDDNNGSADEDGISLLPNLSAIANSYALTLQVNNTTANPARVFAWVDFDGDGEFDENERATLADGTVSLVGGQVPAGASGNIQLQWSGLTGLVAQTTFLRVRISNINLDLTTDGLAEDDASVGLGSFGEIEDYPIIIDPTASLSGNVFDDVDGLNDSTVDGLGTHIGGTLFATLLDATGTTVIAAAPIAADGSYSFANVTSNTTYIVQLGTVDETTQIGGAPSAGPSLPTNWSNTGENLGAGAGDDGTVDGLLTVAVATSNVTEANFGIQTTREFGDAPDSYSTLLASGGPSHNIAVPIAVAGQTCAGAEAQWLYDGDNNDSSGNGHNPIALGGNTTTYATSPFGQSLVFDGSSNITYSATSSFMETAFTSRTILLKIKPGSVSGLQLIFDEGGVTNGLAIALNGNQFEVQVAETNVKAPLLTHPTLVSVGTWYDVKLVYDNGTITLTVDGVATAPLNTGFGQLAAHGDDGGIGSIVGTSAYGGGEIGFTGEFDAACYYTSINGDFDTVVLVNDILLGTERDYELDATPNAAADGDDITDTPDDEDGVSIPALGDAAAAIIPYTVTYNSGNTSFYLNAWIDWNADGDFADAGEQIATDVLASAGANNLNITVPSLGLVADRNTYARFRLSSEQGLGIGGAAIDGEVEDYSIIINPTASLSGNVFDDVDGLNDSTVDGLGTHIGGTLFATLLDATGTTVIAAAPIAADGSYSFANVTSNTTYIVQLGTVDETTQIGGAPSAGPSLPTNWSNTGENLGAGAGDDGTVDGLLTVAVATSDVTEANFGIQTTREFGDAPDSYGTLLASGGPSHNIAVPIAVAGQTCAGAEAQWLYDGDNNDSSGNGHNPVSSTGNVTTYATSPFGQSLVFDGSSNITYSATSSFMETAFTSRTILLKIKPGSVSGLQLIFDEGGVTNGLAIALNGNQFEVQVAETNVKAPLLTHPTLVSVGTWYDVKLVYDNGTITLTVDGVATAPLNTGFGQLAAHGDDGGIGDVRATSAYNGGESGFTGELDAACYYTSINGDFDTVVLVNDILLGTERDYELDATPNAAADGDDITGTPDDEDGVSIPTLTDAGIATIPYTVTYNSGSTVFYLNAWIDWNADGDFADAGEQIATDVLASTGANNLNIIVPALGLVADRNTYARFRLSSQQGLGIGGTAIDGEVEDYAVTITPPLDFGDAPVTYGDACAATDNITYLGTAAPDAESITQYSAAADGDDNNAPSSSLGINFIGDGDSLNAATSAGVLPQTNWNNLAPPSGTVNDLLDSSGSASTADITWSANNSWFIGTGGPDGDSQLMSGYLDTNASGSGDIQIDITNIPFSTYDLYVYYDRDCENCEQGDLTANGITYTTLQEGPTWNIGGGAGSFVVVTDGQTDGNVALFSGLSGDLSLASIRNGTIRGAGINGLQLVGSIVDEDGVSIAGASIQGQTLAAANLVNIDVEVNGNGFLNAWIDFNQNGLFESSELISGSDQPVSTGTTTLNVMVPATAVAGDSFARFIFTETAQGAALAADYCDIANKGEVEDYAVTLTTQIDFGDAPITYGDACAATDNITYLGTVAPDAESITQYSAAADGDDNNAPSSSLGINFIGNGDSLNAATSAGVLPQTNWNNLAAPSGTVNDLLDSNGSASTADITWSANNSWFIGTGGPDGDSRLMSGYLDTNASGSGDIQIDITNIPFSTYDLYVYYDRDCENCEQGDLTANGITYTTLQEGPTWNIGGGAGSFVVVTDGQTDGNVALFSGLSGDLSLASIRNGAIRGAGINGLQLVGSIVEEDGVSIAGASIQGLTLAATTLANIDVEVNGSGFLNAWIDFDRDGLFDSDELISGSDQPVSTGTTTLNVMVPQTITTGDTFVRFIFTETAQGAALAADYCDMANKGEVEDYFLTLVPPTAVTIGKVSLKSMSLADYFSELGIDRMNRAQLLEILAVWSPERAEQLTQASIQETLHALESYLDPDGDAQIAVLHWDTIEELGTIGFYVDRRQLQAPWVRLNNNLLPGLISSPLGAEYQLADRSAVSGETYHYRLAELEANGNTREYGPFTLTMP